MSQVQQLLTEHLDIWISAETDKKSVRGRASGATGNVYGIQKLRGLILDLAVRGKLVPQDPNDEPASELLKRVQAEKAKLIAEGKLKKEKLLAPITDDEKPFGLPKGWEWQRLTETYYSISPKGNQLKGSEIREKGQYPVVDQGQNYISGYTDNSELLIEIPHSIIVFGDHTTNMKLVDFNFVVGADGTKLLAPILIYPNYFFYYLSSYNLENRGYARHFKVLNENLIAIPPITEQRRIVAKAHELLALCDKLEQQHGNAAEAHTKLVEHLLGTLTQAQNPQEFNSQWQRIYTHFDTLFTTEASIDALKQTLLQLAVMGKLVPQDPNDEPASELLKRIQSEKAKLIADGKLKKEKPLPAINEAEKSFNLPSGWEWARLQEVYDVRDGTHDTPRYQEAGFPLVTSKNLYSGILDFSDIKYISESDHLKIKDRSKVDKGDILFAMIGSIGNPVIVDTDIEFSIKNVALFKPYSAELSDTSYLLKYLIKASINFREVAAGAVQSFVSLGVIRNYLIPLPPLTEQRRIVAKVDELMTLCDKLKASIQQASQQQQQLADALVAQALI